MHRLCALYLRSSRIYDSRAVASLCSSHIYMQCALNSNPSLPPKHQKNNEFFKAAAQMKFKITSHCKSYILSVMLFSLPPSPSIYVCVETTEAFPYHHQLARSAFRCLCVVDREWIIHASSDFLSVCALRQLHLMMPDDASISLLCIHNKRKIWK